MKGKETGLLAESGHWPGIISSLETSHVNGVVEFVLHDLGFMMNRSNCGLWNICAVCLQGK
jgi:hypothetical protein